MRDVDVSNRRAIWFDRPDSTRRRVDPVKHRRGRRRKRQRAYLHYLDIALGSQGEVEVHLEIARRLGFLPVKEYERLVSRTVEIGKMLNGLIESMQPYE